MSDVQSLDYMARKAWAPTLENYLDSFGLNKGNNNNNHILNTWSRRNSLQSISSWGNDIRKKVQNSSRFNQKYIEREKSNSNIISELSSPKNIDHIKNIEITKDDSWKNLMWRRNNLKEKIQSIIKMKRDLGITMEDIDDEHLKLDIDDIKSVRKRKVKKSLNKTTIMSKGYNDILSKLNQKNIILSSRKRNINAKKQNINFDLTKNKYTAISNKKSNESASKELSANEDENARTSNMRSSNIVYIKQESEWTKSELSSLNTLLSVNSSNNLNLSNNPLISNHLYNNNKSNYKQSLANNEKLSPLPTVTLQNLNAIKKTKLDSFMSKSGDTSSLLCKLTFEQKNEIINNKLKIFNESEYRKINTLLNKPVYDSLSDSEDEIITANYLLPIKSKFIDYWGNILQIIALYYVWFTPIHLSFLSKTNSIWLCCFYFFANIIYILDIIIMMFKPFLKENIINDDENTWYEFNHIKIFIHYLTGWFFIDILSAIPYYLIIDVHRNYNEKIFTSNIWLNLLYLTPNIKWLKFALIKNSSNKENNLKMITSSIRLAYFCLSFLIFNHFLSCIYCFIALSTYNNWILYNRFDYSNTAHLYFSSMYYNLATIYTIGYGDITPISYIEKVYTILLQGIGIFIYSFVVCSVSTILKKQKEKKYYLKRQYNLTNYFYWKWRKYVLYDFENSNEVQRKMWENFPNSLKNLWISSMYKKDILNFKFFKNTNMEFKTKIIMNLRPIRFEKGEYFVQKGDIYEDMIFNKKGILDIELVYHTNVIRISKIRSWENYGEINMLLNKKSEYDIIVKSNYCESLLLSKEVLIEIWTEFQEISEKIHNKGLCNYNWFKLKAKKKMTEINLKILQETEIKERLKENINDECDSILSNRSKQKIIDIIKEEAEEEDEDNKQDVKKITIIQRNKRSSELISLISGKNITINTNSNITFNYANNSFLEQKNRNNSFKAKVSNIPFKRIVRHLSLSPNKSMKRNCNKMLPVLPKVTTEDNFTFITSDEDSKYICGKLSKMKSWKIHSLRKSICDRRSSTQTGYFVNWLTKNSGCIDLSSSNNLNNWSSKLKRDTKIINKNIIEGKLSIQSPKVFFEGVFKKWKINEQIKKVDELYRILQGIEMF